MIGNKAKFVAFTSAIALMAIGGVAATSISAQDSTMDIEVEVIPDGEPEDIGLVADLTTELQKIRQDKRSDQNNEALRGVHPKSHGCVAADFTVLKYIDVNYRVGLFAEPGTYKALIRYSNASVLLDPDLKDGENGSRGMAIKVLDVNGTTLFPDKDPVSGKNKQNQDFLMINTPEFAFANVRDYLRLSLALLADEEGANPKLFFVPLSLKALGQPAEYESAEVKEKRKSLQKIMATAKLFEGFTPQDGTNTFLSLQVVQKIKSITVRNPLEVQYFSAAPFRFGLDRVMKYSVVPAAGEVPQKAFTPEEAVAQDADYLALALKESLTQGKTIHLSFMIQAVEESQLAGRKEAMIENAALAWSEDEFPFVKVADIAIGPVGANKQLVNDCKSRRFTPWHALAAHEPLGGINRLRNPVYRESGIFRPNKE